MSDMTPEFQREILSLGIISYQEQETLWDIATKCARMAGVPMAGAGFVIGAAAGTVTVPGIGAVPGALFGLLSGLATGTAICTAANVAHRDQLRALLNP